MHWSDQNVISRYCLNISILYTSYDLSDNQNMVAIKQDMCHKAICMLATFRPCNPLKPNSCKSFMYLYIAHRFERLRAVDTSYNNLLRKIWNLPHHCHTAILHCTCVGNVQSICSCVQTTSQCMACITNYSTNITLQL